MKKQQDSLERLQKDNITNVTKQAQIDFYFDFSNPKWKKRHFLFLILEILNFPIIISTFILSPLSNTLKITWVSVFAVILITSIFLFGYKRESYRFLSYLLDIVGMVSVYFLFYYIEIPIESNFPWQLVMIALILVDLIFLLNYISIEYAKERFMSPMVRKNKLRNFYKFGSDKWEDT